MLPWLKQKANMTNVSSGNLRYSRAQFNKLLPTTVKDSREI